MTGKGTARTLGAAVIAAAAAAAMILHEHGLAHALGIDTQQSQEYDFVSGVGPMIITAVLGAGALASLWHVLNCHQQGCARIARFHVAGGQYKVCRRHHPELSVRRGPLAHHILAAHKAHQRGEILAETSPAVVTIAPQGTPGRGPEDDPGGR
ncbi:MAG: hypothetical protein M3Y33_03850 [Actinomycetota bacterium]|nr:hypothetical protein [Actinomycetota bacterium]